VACVVVPDALRAGYDAHRDASRISSVPRGIGIVLRADLLVFVERPGGLLAPRYRWAGSGQDYTISGVEAATISQLISKCVPAHRRRDPRRLVEHDAGGLEPG
jgi:hypothetical protein